MTLSKEDILSKIEEVPFWGQSIPLGHGIITPGKVMDNLLTVKRLQLPDNLRGKRVLDIGAWDGFYSFECERRGASDVVAIDNLCRMQKPDEKQYDELGSKGFLVAKEILKSRVKYFDMDVYNISPEKIGLFDVVLFLGVLYHLKYPLLALEKITGVCKDLLIVETAFLRTIIGEPILQYVEGDSYNQDPTNWHIPNILAMKGMLRDVGFKKIEIVWKTPLRWKVLLKCIIDRRLSIRSRLILKAYK